MRATRAALRSPLIAFAWLLVVGTAAAATPPDGWAPGEVALQARIVAPCCWNQTLDVHASALADALRLEVHERLRAGETRERIEDDLAARYGERVRAVPRGADRRAFVALGVSAFLLCAGLFALLLLWRLRRRGDAFPQELAEPAEAQARDAYDDRLDDELAALSDVEV